MNSDSPTGNTVIASGDPIAENQVFAEIEQLNYLGLRMALGASQSRRLVRRLARQCLDNKLNFANTWMARGPFPPMRTLALRNLHQAASRRKGVVIAACHVGQYHRIPFVLNKLGYAVTLLLDEENQAREQQQLQAWTSRYHGPLQQPIEYINAQLPTAPWKMSQALRKGRMLFVYMDGGTGLQDSDPARTSVEVNFLRLLLRVRKGLAFVAGRAGAPIVPAVCSRSADGKQSVRFSRPCLANHAESLDDYCARAMQYCYSILEERVLRHPDCWEEWYHVHRWVVYPRAARLDNPPITVEKNQEIEFQFDLRNTELLKMPAGPILFHTATGAAIKATDIANAVLRAARRPAPADRLLAAMQHAPQEIEPASILRQLHATGFLRRTR